MAQAKRAEYWEIDPQDGLPSSAWMLVDRHQDCRVIAADGASAHACGKRLNALLDQTQGLLDWMEMQSRNPEVEVMLLPLAGEMWFLFTHFYLSTGYWLFVHLPASDGDSLSLTSSGKLGSVAVFPNMPADLPRERDFDAYASLAWWETVGECLPQPTLVTNELEEIENAVQAVARFCGIRVFIGEVFGVAPGSEGIAPGQTDLCMLRVMLMLIFSSLTRCGVSRVSVSFEGMEEGYALILDASGLDGAPNARTWQPMQECRSLAERNGQIFTCTVQDRAMHLTLCSVRKDYALLGVKIPPFRYE